MNHPGYFDAPVSSLAFCEGQKDARPFEKDGCLWRLRGRAKHSYTLVRFDHAATALQQAQAFRRDGAGVQFLNYTSPKPSWGKRGPTEWIAPEGFDPFHDRSPGTASGLRRAMRGTVVTVPTPGEAREVWAGWLAWATTRKFMVFKGHYFAWLKRWEEGDKRLNLVMVARDGKRGIFGWEVFEGWAQITIAKPEPEMHSKALWLQGLVAVGKLPTLCGSTADKLKQDIGLTPEESWTASTKKLPDPT